LLELDLFQGMNEKTFISQYISILKLMITNQSSELVRKKVEAFVIRCTELASWFTPVVHQDAQKFQSFLLKKFCTDNSLFKNARHYLFTIYRESTLCLIMKIIAQ